MEKKFQNLTRANRDISMSMQVVVPTIKKMLTDTRDSVLAAVRRQSLRMAADSFTHPDMIAGMIAKCEDADALSDKVVADQYRTSMLYIIDNPLDPKVRQAIAAAGGSLKDFLLATMEAIIEVERRS